MHERERVICKLRGAVVLLLLVVVCGRGFREPAHARTRVLACTQINTHAHTLWHTRKFNTQSQPDRRVSRMCFDWLRAHTRTHARTRLCCSRCLRRFVDWRPKQNRRPDRLMKTHGVDGCSQSSDGRGALDKSLHPLHGSKRRRHDARTTQRARSECDLFGFGERSVRAAELVN